MGVAEEVSEIFSLRYRALRTHVLSMSADVEAGANEAIRLAWPVLRVSVASAAAGHAAARTMLKAAYSRRISHAAIGGAEAM